MRRVARRPHQANTIATLTILLLVGYSGGKEA